MRKKIIIGLLVLVVIFVVITLTLTLKELHDTKEFIQVTDEFIEIIERY